MGRLLVELPLARLFLLAAVPLDAGALDSGVVSADICNACPTKSIAATPGGSRPLFYS